VSAPPEPETLVDRLLQAAPTCRGWVECHLLREAAAHIDWLHERLEVRGRDSHGGMVWLGIGDYDGIACRDETIRKLDDVIARIR